MRLLAFTSCTIFGLLSIHIQVEKAKGTMSSAAFKNPLHVSFLATVICFSVWLHKSESFYPQLIKTELLLYSIRLFFFFFFCLYGNYQKKDTLAIYVTLIRVAYITYKLIIPFDLISSENVSLNEQIFYVHLHFSLYFIRILSVIWLE